MNRDRDIINSLFFILNFFVLFYFFFFWQNYNKYIIYSLYYFIFITYLHNKKTKNKQLICMSIFFS